MKQYLPSALHYKTLTHQSLHQLSFLFSQWFYLALILKVIYMDIET